jgi:hypothetical protein
MRGVMRLVDVALRPEEKLLAGEWVSSANGVVGDETCERIDRLTKDVLERIADDATGWESLFRDPADGRLWELYYPHSEMHGGGPPSLRYLTEVLASAKYKLPAAS